MRQLLQVETVDNPAASWLLTAIGAYARLANGSLHLIVEALSADDSSLLYEHALRVDPDLVLVGGLLRLKRLGAVDRVDAPQAACERRGELVGLELHGQSTFRRARRCMTCDAMSSSIAA